MTMIKANPTNATIPKSSRIGGGNAIAATAATSSADFASTAAHRIFLAMPLSVISAPVWIFHDVPDSATSCFARF